MERKKRLGLEKVHHRFGDGGDEGMGEGNDGQFPSRVKQVDMRQLLQVQNERASPDVA